MLDQAIDILLIEDNPDDVELTLHAFRKCAPVLHIHVIRDGAEAMDFLHCTGAYAKRNPHLNPRMILLDLKMPPVDGHYVLRQIRANPYTRTVPVVVLTSSREERDVFRTYQLGINSYIVKPVDFDAFIDAARIIGQYWLSLNHPPIYYQHPAAPEQQASQDRQDR